MICWKLQNTLENQILVSYAMLISNIEKINPMSSAIVLAFN